MAPDKVWWKEGVAYQIYPASFKDGNGDGLGDIPGIISKVDYLRDLGVDILWVSPMYESPQVDMGYDISNYEAVHAPYGTVADMDALIAACHARGMRLILDLVINHTSDQHPWFRLSRDGGRGSSNSSNSNNNSSSSSSSSSSRDNNDRDNPHRDWYIWRPPRIDPATGARMPPTNWRSYFSGSAWAWDEGSGEYYLHLFAKEQPDLNWESADCRRAIYASAMRFWLDKGVDGFRVDTVNMYSKGPVAALRDAPEQDEGVFEQPAWALYANGPRMHEFLREMNAEVLGKYDSMTVGELPHTPDPARVLDYVRAANKELSMVFQFDMVDLGQGAHQKYQYQPWTLSQLKAIVTKWQQFIENTDGWTTAFCENHDQGRSISRFASDAPEYHALSAKLLALFMCSLTGTLFIYQGQEIGMSNIPRDWPIEEYKDIEALGYYENVRKTTNNDPEALAEVVKNMAILGRDNARTPFQWDDSAHAGFTTSRDGPWMRVNDNYTEINVAKQVDEPHSVLSFWKELIKFRKAHADLLVYGAFEVLDPHGEKTFVYVKRHENDKALIALNFSGEEQAFHLPEVGEYSRQVCNYTNTQPDAANKIPGGTKISLRPWEAHLYLRSRPRL